MCLIGKIGIEKSFSSFCFQKRNSEKAIFPTRAVLGLKAHVLVKFCNIIVKNPHFVVMEHEVIRYHKG